MTLAPYWAPPGAGAGAGAGSLGAGAGSAGAGAGSAGAGAGAGVDIVSPVAGADVSAGASLFFSQAKSAKASGRAATIPSFFKFIDPSKMDVPGLRRRAISG